MHSYALAPPGGHSIEISAASAANKSFAPPNEPFSKTHPIPIHRPQIGIFEVPLRFCGMNWTIPLNTQISTRKYIISVIIVREGFWLVQIIVISLQVHKLIVSEKWPLDAKPSCLVLFAFSYNEHFAILQNSNDSNCFEFGPNSTSLIQAFVPKSNVKINLKFAFWMPPILPPPASFSKAANLISNLKSRGKFSRSERQNSLIARWSRSVGFEWQRKT